MTLPRDVRKRLGLSPGDRMSVTVIDGDTIMLRRITPDAAVSLRGLLAHPKQASRIEEMDRGVAAYLGNKVR